MRKPLRQQVLFISKKDCVIDENLLNLLWNKMAFRDILITGITPEEFCAIASEHSERQEARQRARGILGPSIKADDIKDKFKATINVNDFAPDEISVMTENGYLVIECEHEAKKEKYGIVSRHFLTRYQLPDHCQPANVEKRLSARGKLRILTVVATKKVLDAAENEEVTSEVHAVATKVEAVSIGHAAVKEEDVVLEGNAADKE